MDLNPIHHLSPGKKIKCSYFDYVQLLVLARLVNGLKPHPPPLSTQKNEMLIFWLCSTSDDQLGWSMDLNPICQPSPAKKMKCFFLDYVYFWWSARLVDGLEPHLPPLSSQKKWNAHFWIMFTSDDQPGWSMDSNPILHLSPAKEMKCSFLYYVQLLMIGLAGQWTQTPSTTPLQPKRWNAHFCITLNIWCWPDWSMDLNLIHHPSPAKKNEMLLFWLCSTSDDWPGWLKDSNPICHPSPAKKMKSSSLDYVELLMISWAGWWTQTSSASPLQPKKWNAHFWILFNFWWSARLVNELKPHLPPLSSQKMKSSFLDYVHFW